MDQPGKVANSARGQLTRENNIPLSPCVPENLASRDGFSRPVPRQPAHPHTQAESGIIMTFDTPIWLILCVTVASSVSCKDSTIKICEPINQPIKKLFSGVRF